jgi:hypothetical protein
MGVPVEAGDAVIFLRGVPCWVVVRSSAQPNRTALPRYLVGKTKGGVPLFRGKNKGRGPQLVDQT